MAIAQFAFMARQRLILQDIYPYSLTARSNNKEWFDVPLNECWQFFENEIFETSKRYGIRTHCFVLMANHFHWLVSTPNSNLGQAMRYFMTETSRHIARASCRINKIYGARYKPTLLTDGAYYANTIRYFYQNPLRANICTDVDAYPWSTRSRNSKINVSPCETLEALIPTDKGELKRWLNTIPAGPYQLMMQKALRRAKFEFPKHPSTRRYIERTNFLN